MTAYTKILLPLDGSKVAEQVLPYARSLAKALKIPVELLGIVDIGAITATLEAQRARSLGALIEEGRRASQAYLDGIGRTIPGVSVNCSVETGTPQDVIIERAAADQATLIAMGTHGRSGLDRWMMGSVTEKVLRGASNPMLLIRAAAAARTDGQATLKSVIVPLDGSELAETVLPGVVSLAQTMGLEVILLRAYNVPFNIYAGGDAYYAIDFEALIDSVKETAVGYLENQVEKLKAQGLAKVSGAALEGLSADKIIEHACKMPNSLIAMCSHGRSGVKRWVLGSVTETVARHSSNPMLIFRAS
jgi:nucleotide-binding universal stress UspA family protein